jgi:hypothetical protein
MPRRWLCLPLLLVLGCNDVAPSPDAPGCQSCAPGSHYDPSTTGTVHGRVLWEGDLPGVPPLEVRTCPLFGAPLDHDHFRENPHVPLIDSDSRGLAGAVVFLHGVDPEKARPWDHGPVCVEQRGCGIHVLQDGADAQVGFVRRGDPVTVVSRDEVPHALHFRGAVYFTLTFPDPGMPLQHRLERTGRVELSSGMGYFWMRGHLFVAEHPYYARTDALGRFTLQGVPPGRYQLVCWIPNWIVGGYEREPENGTISRLYFREPVVQEQDIEVRPGGTVSARFSASLANFPHPAEQPRPGCPVSWR